MEDEKTVSEAIGELFGIVIALFVCGFMFQYAWNNAPIQYCLDNHLEYWVAFCSVWVVRSVVRK